MRIVRVVDVPGRRKESHGREDHVSRDQVGRPSVYQRFYHYWCGAGWHDALREAVSLLASGAERAIVAQSVGWRIEELDAALGGDRPRMAPPCRCFDTGHGPHAAGCAMAGWREGQQRESRPARRNDPTPEVLLKARRMYEDDFMTVPEVAVALGMSRGQAYLLLCKARTSFRRRGRRTFDGR